MDARTEHIIEAAQRRFARYGVAKTTMSDIATEAGVARQTVYNAFPNKEAVLRAAVRHFGNQTYDQVRAAWDAGGDLSDKLWSYIELGPLAWYAALQEAPDLEELLDGIHRGAGEVMAELSARWRDAILHLLIEAGATPRDPGTSLDDVTEFFHFATMNAKYGVASEDQLRTRLAVTHRATLAMLTD